MRPVNWDLAPNRNHITPLRLLLAAAVILAHSWTLFVPVAERASIAWAGVLGDTAVHAFFALSGCLIAASWQRSPRWGEYLRRRILRIYPGYLVAGLICALLVAPFGVASAAAYFRGLSLPHYLTDILRLSMIQTPGAFKDMPDPYLNGSSWTIQMEFLCYLFVPVLVWLPPRGRAALFAAFLGLYAVQLFVPQLSWCSLDAPSTWHELRFPLPLLWQGRWPRLLSAFLSGLVFLSYRDRLPHSNRLAAACAGLLVVGFVVHEAAFRLLWPLAGTYLMVWLAWHPRLRMPPWFEKNDISYGTYLYAFPIQQLLIRHVPGLSPPLLFALAVPLSLGAGWISWSLVESRCLRWKLAAKPRIHAASK